MISNLDLYRAANLDMIEVGNFEDDMPRIADCDWIIEVVVERLDIKLKVFEHVAKHRSPGTIVTSNKVFKHWPEIFNNDATVTSAVLDRLLVMDP